MTINWRGKECELNEWYAVQLTDTVMLEAWQNQSERWYAQIDTGPAGASVTTNRARNSMQDAVDALASALEALT